MSDSLQRQKYETGAVRNNTDKLRYDLIPVAALQDVAKVLTVGAAKYGERNWEKGFPWSNPYASLQRHMQAWWSGEDLDPETGLSHLAHACCNLMMLQQFEHVYREGDDRPKGTIKHG